MQRMDPRPARCAAVLAALAFACGGEPARRTAPPGAPNVLLVSIDSLRPDHLGCYGYRFATSPTIDGLARDGVRFQQAVSTTSWTLPAHASLFTGLYDSGHGLVENGLRLAESQVTLAEVFQRNGWQTVGFFGGPYLHPTFGMDQGFERYQSCMTSLADALPEEEVRNQSHAQVSAAHKDVTGPRTVTEVGRWLAQADERPFFAFVHLWDVHYDYIAPPEYVALFDADYHGDLNGVDVMRNARIAPGMDERDLRHLLALYDAEIRFTDDTLKALLKELEERGELANTIVVVTADHGEEFLEHGGKGHQRTLYEEVLRIPLVFHWPGHLGASVGADPLVPAQQVRLVDVMPTLLALCGIQDVPTMCGRDLSALLRGDSLTPEPALAELYTEGRDIQALRTDTFKVIRAASRGVLLGHDLLADPEELQPLPGLHPQVANGLKMLDAELDKARRAGRGRGAKPAKDIDPAVLEHLRNLGYTGGGEHR